jgi:hypothetical protein
MRVEVIALRGLTGRGVTVHAPRTRDHFSGFPEQRHRTGPLIVNIGKGLYGVERDDLCARSC